MNDFKKGGFRKSGGDFGGRPKFGNKFGGGDRKFGGGKKFGGGFGGGRDRGDKPFGRPELFPATCSSCGKGCEVPFRPTGEKPVYCRDCFGKQEQAPWRADERRAPRQERDFRPRSDAPAHASNGGGDIEGLKYRFNALETKVDRMLEILSKGQTNTTKTEAKGMSKPEVAAPVVVATPKPLAPKKVVKAKKGKK